MDAERKPRKLCNKCHHVENFFGDPLCKKLKRIIEYTLVGETSYAHFQPDDCPLLAEAN